MEKERKIEGEKGSEGVSEGHIPVLSHVEDLGADEKGHVVHADSDQYFVPGAVERLVVVAVDLDDFISHR